VEIAVVGRRTDISDKFRDLIDAKLAKVEQLAPGAQHIDVEVTRETNPSLADVRERVELTVTGKGPVVRAEAAAPDREAALDAAVDKLNERLRRARDRAKGHRGAPIREVLAEVAARALDADAVLENLVVETEDDAAKVMAAATLKGNGPLVVDGDAVESRLGDSPVIIRQKLHSADRMTLAEAVEQMELVGHDFFLFIDSEAGRPSAVYRRKGWTYGVIQLDAIVN
jgi:ribosomal subunit interface protein